MQESFENISSLSYLYPPFQFVSDLRFLTVHLLVYCVKSPFTLFVIPGLTRNPVFLGCHSRFRGNDSFGTNGKKRWTHYTSLLNKSLFVTLNEALHRMVFRAK